MTSPKRITFTTDDGSIVNAFHARTYCLVCDGTGVIETQQTGGYSPNATEPIFHESPCPLCGTEDRAGTGQLDVLRCSCCGKIVEQAIIEEMDQADAAFQGDGVAYEDLEWQYSRELSKRQREQVAEDVCTCDAETLEGWNARLLTLSQLASEMTSTSAFGGRLNVLVRNGIHHLTIGELAMLTFRPIRRFGGEWPFASGMRGVELYTQLKDDTSRDIAAEVERAYAYR